MPATTVANLVHAVETSGFKVDEIIVGSIAETLLVLATPEMFARTCHINIGHGMTTLTVVNDGKIIHTHSLSIGGRDITRAIADEFEITEDIANQLKIRYGKVIPHAGEAPNNQVIYVDESKEEMKFITRGRLNEVITDLTSSLFKVIKTHIVDELRLREQEYHYSLTGATAELPNILYSLQSQLPMIATIYRPPMLGIRDAKFSSIVGVSIFAHELTLLLGSNPNAQKFEFNGVVEKLPSSQVKTKKDVIPQVEKVSPPRKRLENTQSLKDAIAGASTLETTVEEKTKKIPIFDDFDHDASLLGATPLETNDDDYINQKLSNSGALARFFGRILNENDDDEKL